MKMNKQFNKQSNDLNEIEKRNKQQKFYTKIEYK